MARGACIWAVVFAVLAAALAIVTPAAETAAVGPEQVAIVSITPMSIERMVLRRDDTEAELVRAGVGWDVVTPEGVWPAESGVAAGVVRLVTSALGTPIDREGFEAGATLTIETSAEARSIEIADRTLGGTTRVRTDAGVFRVGDEWQRIFVVSGAAPWRSSRVLPTIERGVRSIELRSGEQRLRLERAGRGWAMTAPVTARGRADSAEALLAVLAGLESDGTAEGAAPEAGSAAAAASTASVVIEQQPSDSSEARTWTLDLALGGTVAGDLVASVVARQGGVIAYSRSGLRIAADTLSRLTLDPAAYVQRIALQASSADVLAIRVGDEQSTRRPEGGWPEPITAAIDALASEAASDTVIGELSGAAEPMTLALEGLGGAVLGEFDVLADDEEVWLGERGVWRRYDGAAGDALRGLVGTTAAD
mgnify:CR=1 FL=1